MIRSDLWPVPNPLKEDWATSHNIRITDFLEADVAARVLTALRELPHPFAPRSHRNLKYQFGLRQNYPDVDCDHVLCALTHCWFSDVLRWVMACTGEALEPPEHPTLDSTLYTKGSYLDPHNDKAPQRRIAFVLGLTPTTWPADQGGHLEFLEQRDGRRRVVQRRQPGFNTLDLFDVHRQTAVHQIPLLTHAHERRAISGWFHGRPNEADRTLTT